jgi:hypothetical protein
LPVKLATELVQEEGARETGLYRAIQTMLPPPQASQVPLPSLREMHQETQDKVAGAVLELQSLGSELEELRRQALAEAGTLAQARQQRIAEEALLADLLCSRRAEISTLEQQLAALQAQLTPWASSSTCYTSCPGAPKPSGPAATNRYW